MEAIDKEEDITKDPKQSLGGQNNMTENPKHSKGGRDTTNEIMLSINDQDQRWQQDQQKLQTHKCVLTRILFNSRH